MVGKTVEKIIKKESENLLDKTLGELESSTELQIINNDNLIVSYDFNSLYSSAK